MDSDYERDKVCASFKESAQLAEWFYRAHVHDGLRDTGAAAKRDELLARMLVYAHLQDGAFLQTREQLLAELRWLLKHERPLAPRHALSPATFARYRAKLLQMLIDRFEQDPGAENPVARRAQG
jgi:hypothetical protein